jgi:hypothetical protein
MLKKQVAVTPPPQWVRVVGGFNRTPVCRKRLPTLEPWVMGGSRRK